MRRFPSITLSTRRLSSASSYLGYNKAWSHVRLTHQLTASDVIRPEQKLRVPSFRLKSRRPYSPLTPSQEPVSSLRHHTMAIDYETILKGKYPAKQHAKQVVELIRAKVPDANGIIYLEGQRTKMIEDNDGEEHFRQRRYFFYLTGCPLPDCYFTYDLATSKSTLFIPPIDPESVIWSGLPVTAEEAQAAWEVDEVRYTNEINPALATLAGTPSDSRPKTAVFAIPNQVSDHVTFLQFDDKNFGVLKDAIERARVVKSDYEVALIAKANVISSAAHKEAMKRVRHVKNEGELEAAFLASCIAAGAKNQAYHGIFASGRGGATLHYVANDKALEGKQNMLIDAAAEVDCYAADITRTFPISGKFTAESRAIYDIVLKMQLDCMAMLKEGVVWDDVHTHAHKIAIDGLLSLGILKGDKDEILKARTSVAFFPHGLGHYLGMDTHDTGGNANYSDKDTMFRYLRVRGNLPAGSVITVEPGIYFCSFIIEPYLTDPVHSRYIDATVLEKYWDVGGVRIEDNVLITASGHTNLTPAIKDVAEMESVIASG